MHVIILSTYENSSCILHYLGLFSLGPSTVFILMEDAQ